MVTRYIILKYLTLIIAASLITLSASAGVNITGNKHVFIAKRSIFRENAGFQTVSDITGIIDELDDKRLKRILSGVLKIKGGKIGKIIEKLESHTPDWLWVVREGSLPENVNGQTKLTSKGALSILDYTQLENATNLSIARTIIHEMVHVYLTLYYRYDQIRAIKDFPAIYNAWQIKKYADYNQIQHDEIEKTFVNDIASALKEYSVNTNMDANDLIYYDLAWGGLNVQNSRLLTDKEKRRIQNRLSAEQSGRRNGTENRVGTRLSKTEINFCNIVIGGICSLDLNKTPLTN
jgi:hypothetical protein